MVKQLPVVLEPVSSLDGKHTLFLDGKAESPRYLLGI